MLKKRLAVFFAAILGVLLLAQVSVFAVENTLGIVVDNYVKSIGVKTVVEKDTIMIPAKELAESIGASFKYDVGDSRQWFHK